MEENPIPENSTPKFVDSFEELSVNQQQEPQQEFDATTAPDPTPQESQEAPQQPQVNEPELTISADESSLNDMRDLDTEVFAHLSQRLGREISSYDDLSQKQYELDEGIRAIADFVEETGRRPEDWFTYQSLNPENMDDMSAIMVNMSAQYPNLSQDEVRTLVTSKYKLDENRFSEEEVNLSKLQLKMDSEEARRQIQDVREKYRYERQESGESEELFDSQWIDTMRDETMSLGAVEFDLGQGESFRFGIDPSYSKSLVDKNSSLETYFDQYISDDGDWNFDKFNADRTVLDNIDKIISAVYRRGLGDGQRGLLNTSANIQSTTPQRSGLQPSSDPVADQLRQAMGMNSNSMTFKL